MTKKVILVLILHVGFIFTSIANANIPNLIGYWKLDEISGRIAHDSSGNKNHGTLVGGIDWAPTNGKFKGAVCNDRTDYSFVEIPATGIRPMKGTLVMWVYLAEPQPKHQRRGYRFLFGSGLRENRVQLYMNNNDSQLDLGLGNKHRKHLNIINLATETWYHIALTWDVSNYVVYIDGNKKAAGTYKSLTGLQSKAAIGDNGHEGGQAFHGLIDDVAIFDRALSEDEVAQAYSRGVDYLIAEPVLKELIDATTEAEAILKEEPQKAIAFVEDKLAKYNQWKEEAPNDVSLLSKQVSSILYYELARAKEKAGLSKKDIAGIYKLAIESNALSLVKQGYALLWLYKNLPTEEYEDVVTSYIQKNIDYFGGTAQRAEIMIAEHKLKEALGFLEGNLSVYMHWRRDRPGDTVIAHERLPEIYFQLAKVREAAGMPQKSIAQAYNKTFSSSLSNYIPKQVTALIWLLENDFTEEYTEVIRSFTQSHEIKGFFKKVVHRICEDFESKKNWAKYKQLLDTLFAEAKYPSEWAVFVESRLGNKANQWAREYFNYLDSKPELKFGRDCIIAEKYMAEEKFVQARELYQAILSRCSSKDDKEIFELRLCECLFEVGEYHKAISRLSNFIIRNKKANGDLVKKAMLIEGRALVQLNELDKAIDVFSILMIEYPEAKEAPEANFYVGYCYLLEDQLDIAMEAFNCLVKSNPKSRYAGRARQYLSVSKK